jgi:hypothetical protein
MAAAKYQVFENIAVKINAHRLGLEKKKGC